MVRPKETDMAMGDLVMSEALDKTKIEVRIPDSLVDSLQKLAITEGTSRASIVAKALDLYMNQNSEFDLICRALELCPECKKDMQRWTESSGRSLTEIFRHEIWKYWGEWPHGSGCTPEQRSR